MKDHGTQQGGPERGYGWEKWGKIVNGTSGVQDGTKMHRYTDFLNGYWAVW